MCHVVYGQHGSFTRHTIDLEISQHIFRLVKLFRDKLVSVEDLLGVNLKIKLLWQALSI